MPIAGWPRIGRVCLKYSRLVSAHAIQRRNHASSAAEKRAFSAESRAGIMSMTLFHPAIAMDEISE